MTEFLRLKKSNCKNCYKCIRHCPVKSIRFSGNQAHIVYDECILCGQCFVVCPQNAKEIADSTELAKVLLSGDAPVIASIAPSFVANYNGAGIKSLEKALKQLGFFAVEETAIGATMVKNEYDKIVNSEQQDVIITSACPSVNLLIQKHFPGVLKYLAPVISPMQAHCIDIKRRYPNAKTIFIGPCVSKKEEADGYKDIVDCVLTFEELSKMLDQKEIAIETFSDKDNYSKTRVFPTAGGIIKSMDCSNENYSYLSVDGSEKCISAIKDIENGSLSHCFIEMSMCSGSCIGGPVMEKFRRSPVRDYQAVEQYAGKKDFKVDPLPKNKLLKSHPFLGKNKAMPSDEEIKAILKQIGKTKPEDELNCGSCGYETCREKAIAVFQGKADLTMCLPFLKERAESFSGNIVDNTPNGIFVLNENLEVQQINKAALKIMNLHHESDVLGEQVIRILDPKDFIDVKNTGRSIRDRRIFLAEYNKFVEETIICDKEYHLLICIMRDVTDEEYEREKKEQISRHTVVIADKVVDKQMRVVQEIASLLGETTAETKIALTKLKESISDE